MRLTRLLAAVALCGQCALAGAETPPLQRQYLLDNVLHRCVKDGRVDYAKVKTDGDLDKYLAAMAEVSLDELHSDASRLAFWINVYNACVLKSIAEAWPVTDIAAVPNMRSAVRWKVAGVTRSLDQMRDEVLRPLGKGLVHFALCDGTEGGPALGRRTFSALDLDAQLEAAAREYLNREGVLKINRIAETLTLPVLFRTFAADFEPEGVPRALGPYLATKRDQVFVTGRRLKLEYVQPSTRVNALLPETPKPQSTSSKPTPKDTPPAKTRVWSVKDGKWVEK